MISEQIEKYMDRQESHILYRDETAVLCDVGPPIYTYAKIALQKHRE